MLNLPFRPTKKRKVSFNTPNPSVGLPTSSTPFCRMLLPVPLKASVYLYGHGSEERMSLVPLHDEPNGVIMALHCFEMHDEHLFPENVDYCKELHDRYDNYDYESLMNTTFGVVPGGRSPGSFRLAEVHSALQAGMVYFFA